MFASRNTLARSDGQCLCARVLGLCGDYMAMIRAVAEVAGAYGVIDDNEIGNPLIWLEISEKSLN
jgi:hypothetical protein